VCRIGDAAVELAGVQAAGEGLPRPQGVDIARRVVVVIGDDHLGPGRGGWVVAVVVYRRIGTGHDPVRRRREQPLVVPVRPDGRHAHRVLRVAHGGLVVLHVVDDVALPRDRAGPGPGPARLSTPITRLRKAAMTPGAAPVRTWEASSAKVMWCSASMAQCPRSRSARRAGRANSKGRLVSHRRSPSATGWRAGRGVLRVTWKTWAAWGSQGGGPRPR
jgi:hypothetical protein